VTRKRLSECAMPKACRGGPVCASKSGQTRGSASPSLRHCRLKPHSQCVYLYMMVVFLLITVCHAPSSAQGTEADPLINKALKLSGVTGPLEKLGGAILSAIPGDAFPDMKMRNEVAAYVKKEAGKEALLSIVRAAVREDFDKESIEKVISFYDSKVGRKIGRLQEASLDPGLLKNIREGRKIASSLEEPRLSLLRRIMKTEGVSELNGTLLRSVIRGFVDGSPAEDPGLATSAEAVQKKINIMEKAIQSGQNRTEDVALVAFAYTFRSVDDKELEELAAYQETPQAAWFRSAVQKGFDRAVYQTARSLGEAVTRWRNLPPQGGPVSVPSDKGPETRGGGNG
jgi:hypothetical protein